MEMITDRTTPVAKFSTCIFVINRSSKVVRLQDTQVGVVEKKAIGFYGATKPFTIT